MLDEAVILFLDENPVPAAGRVHVPAEPRKEAVVTGPFTGHDRKWQSQATGPDECPAKAMYQPLLTKESGGITVELGFKEHSQEQYILNLSTKVVDIIYKLQDYVKVETRPNRPKDMLAVAGDQDQPGMLTRFGVQEAHL